MKSTSYPPHSTRDHHSPRRRTRRRSPWPRPTRPAPSPRTWPGSTSPCRPATNSRSSTRTSSSSTQRSGSTGPPTQRNWANSAPCWRPRPPRLPATAPKGKVTAGVCVTTPMWRCPSVGTAEAPGPACLSCLELQGTPGEHAGQVLAVRAVSVDVLGRLGALGGQRGGLRGGGAGGERLLRGPGADRPRAHVGQRDPPVDGRDPDDRPVVRPLHEFLVTPAGARPARHPHRAEQFAGLEAGLEEAGKEVGGGGGPGSGRARGPHSEER